MPAVPILRKEASPIIQRTIAFEYDDVTGEELKKNKVISPGALYIYLTRDYDIPETDELYAQLDEFDRVNAIFSDTEELIEVLGDRGIPTSYDDEDFSELEYQGNNYWYNASTGQYYYGAEDEENPVLLEEPPDRIYLVGEGDFSFALSRVLAYRGKPVIIKATAYESREEVMARPKAQQNVLALEQLGIRIEFNIDATALDEEPVSPRLVDKLGFVFPHAGGGGGDEASIREYVLRNEPLLTKFLETSFSKLAPDGSAFVVMKNTMPYSLITKNFPAYAETYGYTKFEDRGFAHPDDYEHVQTASSKKVVDKSNARLFIFTK